MRGKTLKENKLEAPTRFELVIKVLQTLALPLGDGATRYCYYNTIYEKNQEKFKTFLFFLIFPLIFAFCYNNSTIMRLEI